MTDYELEVARQLLKQRELSKTPEGRAALEYARKKREENEKRNKILASWGEYGYYISPDQKKELKKVQKTAAEARREDILKHYS